jgi:cyclophilin family peptidyl-prolyl cis-trans isomerase
MCQDNNQPASGVGAFCILLGKAPQLDGKYCIFGHMADDANTMKTIHALESQWAKNKFCIKSAK